MVVVVGGQPPEGMSAEMREMGGLLLSGDDAAWDTSDRTVLVRLSHVAPISVAAPENKSCCIVALRREFWERGLTIMRGELI